MITYGNALNCFTDASYIDGTTCAGYVLVYKGKILEQDARICSCKSNNYGEAYAVYMGVLALYRNINISPYLNLFSDSKLTTDALKDWCRGWVKASKDGIFRNKEGKEVANQEVFKSIIYNIYWNNTTIQIFHQLAHLNRNSEKDMKKMKERFFMENGVILSDEILLELCHYNAYIDHYTRNCMINIKKRGYRLDSFGAPMDIVHREIDHNIINNYIPLLQDENGRF